MAGRRLRYGMPNRLQIYAGHTDDEEKSPIPLMLRYGTPTKDVGVDRSVSTTASLIFCRVTFDGGDAHRFITETGQTKRRQ